MSGGASWDTATPLPVGGTSSTSLADLLEGTDFPYQSAWWVITPDADLSLIIDSNLSDPSIDTVLIVYEGADYATAGQVASDDDSGGVGFLSKVDVTLSAGTTYHVRLGTYGGYTGTIVLRTTRWEWSPWIQAPNVQRTRAFAALTEVIHGGSLTLTGTSTFDLATANNALIQALAATSGWVESFGEDASVGAGVTGSNRKNNPTASFTYSGDSNNASVRKHLALPPRGFSPSDFTPPADSLGGVELASGDGEVLASGITYTATEGTYYSPPGGGPAQPLTGRWSYLLTLPNQTVTILGAQGTVSGDALGSASLPVPMSLVNDDDSFTVAAALNFESVTIPANTSVGLSDHYEVGASWDCVTYLTLQPPLYRYKMAVTATPPTPYVPPALARPSLRMLQRGGSGGMAGIPRMVGNPTTRGSLRRGPGSVY